jgi:hypothetical protein
MNKCILIVGFMVVAGCTNEAVKSESVKWASSGTLVSVGPDVESTRRPGRVKSSILGETKLNSTRVETTEGVYIISEKIGVVEPGVSVSVGYNSADENRDTPLYLTFGGQRYKIVR